MRGVSRCLFPQAARVPIIRRPIFHRSPSEKLPMRRPAVWLAVVCLALPLAGCGWFSSPSTRLPRLRDPGPAEYQQHQAERVADPYPDNESAPEVEGGRPRGFDKPFAETPRSQNRARQGGSIGPLGF